MGLMYMQYFDVCNDKDCIGFPTVHAITTWTNTKHYKRQIAAEKFIHKHVEDLYCLQTSGTIGLPDLTINYDRNVFCFVLHSSMGHYRNSFLLHFLHVYYITRIIRHCWVILVKDVCMTQRDANNIDHILRMLFSRLLKIVSIAPEISGQKSDDAPYSYF